MRAIVTGMLPSLWVSRIFGVARSRCLRPNDLLKWLFFIPVYNIDISHLMRKKYGVFVTGFYAVILLIPVPSFAGFAADPQVACLLCWLG